MKKLLFTLCGVLLLADAASAQTRDNLLPRGSTNALVGQTIGVTDVTVTYGRPAVRERVLFGAEGSGALEPYGRVWRLGANEATTITFSSDVRVGDVAVPAGTYGLFAIPGAEQWTFVVNRVAKQWGAYQYDAAQDVARVEVTPSEGPHTEHLLLWFDELTESSARLMMAWGTARAGVTIHADADAVIAARAEQEVAEGSDWQRIFRYAGYGLSRGLDPQAVLAWAERAVTLNEAYATVALKARLQAATGAYEDAIATGEAALALAEAMETPPRDLDAFREAIEGWRGEM